MAVVALDRLSKVYDRAGAKAVDDVSLEVADGELMVLLGPSGCGKTTTLRMIAGLESISGGRLMIGGRVVNDVPAKDRDIAMVFQSYALYPHMTVKDNLAFGLRRRAIEPAEIQRRVAQVAESLGLSALLGRRPHALSGGQRQRVALGRAIVRDPEVFLFDEPLSNLDAGLRASTRQELAQLHQRLAATMIYVTHDQVEAMTLGDRICVMNGGRVAQVGTPIEVYKRPASLFVARFLGAPPMNIVKSQIAADGGSPTATIGETRVTLDRLALPAFRRLTEQVLLGFRPEAVRLGNGRPGDLAITGTVKLVERLGAETVTTAALAAGTDVLARTPGDNPAAAGDRIALHVDPHDLYAFDPATGDAIATRD